MSDYVIVPLSATEGARVQFPLDLPRQDRAAWLDKLPPAVLANAERVPLSPPQTED